MTIRQRTTTVRVTLRAMNARGIIVVAVLAVGVTLTAAGCGDSTRTPVDENALATAIQHDAQASADVQAPMSAIAIDDYLSREACGFAKQAQTNLAFGRPYDDLWSQALDAAQAGDYTPLQQAAQSAPQIASPADIASFVQVCADGGD